MRKNLHLVSYLLLYSETLNLKPFTMWYYTLLFQLLISDFNSITQMWKASSQSSVLLRVRSESTGIPKLPGCRFPQCQARLQGLPGAEKRTKTRMSLEELCFPSEPLPSSVLSPEQTSQAFCSLTSNWSCTNMTSNNSPHWLEGFIFVPKVLRAALINVSICCAA